MKPEVNIQERIREMQAKINAHRHGSQLFDETTILNYSKAIWMLAMIENCIDGAVNDLAQLTSLKPQLVEACIMHLTQAHTLALAICSEL